jgi:hypothetical protein
LDFCGFWFPGKKSIILGTKEAINSKKESSLEKNPTYGEIISMPMCSKCRVECDEAELRDISDQRLCEDCYIDNVGLSKTCDPWAVHSAKNLVASQGLLLTPDQEKLLELVKAEKEIGFPEAAERLGLTEKQLQENFTVLRHMEQLRAAKKGNSKVIALF